MTTTQQMKKQQTRFLPIADMHVSKLNMRHGKGAPNIDDIYPSILKGGINQSLLVRKEGKGWGIIAGRRRYFALKKKAKATGKPVKAPCLIMQSGDVKAAREASLLENVARLPASTTERFAAFKGLADAGQTTGDIAETFGVTELSVRQTLALAALLPEILELYEVEEVRADTLRALTLATADQQADWLKLYHGDDYAPQGEQLKAWLTGGARIKTDTALFDLEAYSGAIITDLFGESGYFQDPDLFWEHQNTAIAETVANLKSDGWSDVILLERGDHFLRWEHGERSQEQGGKVFIATGHDGSVEIHRGFLSNADIKKIEAILGGNDDEKAEPQAKPELSGPLTEYVSLHRHAAIRASLIDHPAVALRIAVAHMLTSADNWWIDAQKTTSRKDATSESVAASAGAVRFEKERAEVFALLGLSLPSHEYGSAKRLTSNDVITVFSTLMQVDDATVMRTLTLAMGMSLAAGNRAVEALTYAIPVDMSALWQPDDAFFDLLRDKTVINALVKDIAGKSCADAALTDTGKVQKEIIRNRIAGHGVKKAASGWRPRWMQIPARHYLNRDGCLPAVLDSEVAELMNSAEEAKVA